MLTLCVWEFFTIFHFPVRIFLFEMNALMNLNGKLNSKLQKKTGFSMQIALNECKMGFGDEYSKSHASQLK